jgi:Flp pilus assembly pilin Flp
VDKMTAVLVAMIVALVALAVIALFERWFPLG